MNTSKVNFKNANGETLSGYLELPTNQHPHNFVIFAHCFTCNKNFFAPKNISHALSSSGFGILRFDFTGLGESEGDFSETNFSGNIEDLKAAAKFLKNNYKAPSLFIGHSLGGAAALLAAKDIASVKAIATIAAPSTIAHVKGLMQENIDEIMQKGEAIISVGGRPFTVKKQFLEDLHKHKLDSLLSQLRKALLILHAPTDKIVDIKNAEELYTTARHPKSFISLDGANHLLSDQKDSLYTGQVISSWAKRYVDIPVEEKPESAREVVANLGENGFTTQIKAGDHFLTADEPKKMGGDNFGPTPYQFLSAGLGACTSMTIQMYARRKKWTVENVETHVSYSKQHIVDCENCEDESAKIDTFEREIMLKGDLDEEKKKKLLEIANKCPVHKTLHKKAQIITKLSSFLVYLLCFF